FNFTGCHRGFPTLCDSTVPCTDTTVATHFSHVCAKETEGCSTTTKRLMPIRRDKRGEKLLCITHSLFSLTLMIRKRGGKPPRAVWAWTSLTGVAVVNNEEKLLDVPARDDAPGHIR